MIALEHGYDYTGSSTGHQLTTSPARIHEAVLDAVRRAHDLLADDVDDLALRIWLPRADYPEVLGVRVELVTTTVHHQFDSWQIIVIRRDGSVTVVDTINLLRLHRVWWKGQGWILSPSIPSDDYRLADAAADRSAEVRGWMATRMQDAAERLHFHLSLLLTGLR